LSAKETLMNIVYLSPHFPPRYHRFCRHLKQAWPSVLGIGDAPYDHLAVEVRDSLTEYFYPLFKLYKGVQKDSP
jgi:hypothetical protein